MTLIKNILLVIVLVITSVLLADDQIVNNEKSKFIGEYKFISESGTEKIRTIELRNDYLIYVVNDELQIPLKPISDHVFNLYPSETNMVFEFDDKGDILKVKIIKGSGGVMEGKKFK